MNLVLVEPWNGLPVGFRLVGVQQGQAYLMLQKGLAVKADDEEEKPRQPKQGKRQK